MDISSLVQSLLSSGNVKDISKAASASSGEVKSVLTAAVPHLLSNGGKLDASGIASLVKAKGMSAILAKLFGKGSTEQIAEEAGVSSATTGNILSTVAPLLTNALSSGSQEAASQESAGSGLLGMLGGLISTNTEDEKPASGKKPSSAKKPASDKKEGGLDLGNLLSGLLK